MERIIKGQLSDGRYFTSIDGNLYVEPEFLARPDRITPPLMRTPEPTRRTPKLTSEEIMDKFFKDER